MGGKKKGSEVKLFTLSFFFLLIPSFCFYMKSLIDPAFRFVSIIQIKYKIPWIRTGIFCNLLILNGYP